MQKEEKEQVVSEAQRRDEIRRDLEVKKIKASKTIRRNNCARRSKQW